MPHEHPHISSESDGYRLCSCMCNECWQPQGCICSLCQCDLPAPDLHPAYYPEPVAKDQHTCKKCGVEVYRKGTKGRYPSLCLECRD